MTSWLEGLGVKRMYANISYEVDELRRDINTCKAGNERGIKCDFVHDKLVVRPGLITTKEKKPYTVRRSSFILPNPLSAVRFIRLGFEDGLHFLTTIWIG